VLTKRTCLTGMTLGRSLVDAFRTEDSEESDASALDAAMMFCVVFGDNCASSQLLWNPSQTWTRKLYKSPVPANDDTKERGSDRLA
jgi:hypothetical protein